VLESWYLRLDTNTTEFGIFSHRELRMEPFQCSYGNCCCR
ncbi:hypothetical protein A2U01_0054321, partial [Trifolium medium]|nr:hypothetical protein [Trifolium medium]